MKTQKYIAIGLIVIVAIALLCTANFHIPNSGQHTGYVSSVEQSGLIWKTWTAYVKTDPQSSQEDSYCVTDQSVVNQLQSAATERSSVTVYYSVPLLTWKWQCGYEQSTIQSVDMPSPVTSNSPVPTPSITPVPNPAGPSSTTQDETRQTEIYREECVVKREQVVKQSEDFLNACTGNGNSVDFCGNTSVGKDLIGQAINPNFITNCINDKRKLLY